MVGFFIRFAKKKLQFISILIVKGMVDNVEVLNLSQEKYNLLWEPTEISQTYLCIRLMPNIKRGEAHLTTSNIIPYNNT